MQDGCRRRASGGVVEPELQSCSYTEAAKPTGGVAGAGATSRIGPHDRVVFRIGSFGASVEVTPAFWRGDHGSGVGRATTDLESSGGWEFDGSGDRDADNVDRGEPDPRW